MLKEHLSVVILFTVASFFVLVPASLSGCRDRKDDDSPAESSAPSEEEKKKGADEASEANDDSKENPESTSDEDNLSSRITRVSRSRDSHWGYGHQVAFFVEVEKQTESGTVPVENPALLYASLVEPESGELYARGMCDRPRRPHECSFDGEHFENGDPGSLVLEVTATKDGPTGTLALSLPPVPGRGAPGIINTSVSENEPRKYGVTFQDTGAASFDVVFVFFRGTYSDGDPFVDVDVATLERNDAGELEMTGPERGMKGYGYTVTLDVTEENVTVTAEGGEQIEESIDRMAVCGEEKVPADDNTPEAYMRECGFQEFGEE